MMAGCRYARPARAVQVRERESEAEQGWTRRIGPLGFATQTRHSPTAHAQQPLTSGDFATYAQHLQSTQSLWVRIHSTKECVAG